MYNIIDCKGILLFLDGYSIFNTGLAGVLLQITVPENNFVLIDSPVKQICQFLMDVMDRSSALRMTNCHQ